MKKIFLIVVMLLAARFGFAQEDTHRKLAEEFLSLTKVDQQMQMMLDQMKTMQTEQLSNEENSKEALAVQDEMYKVMSDAFRWEKIKDKYIGIYVSEFSEDDLKEIIAFYKSPVGQKFLEKCKQGSRIESDIFS